MSDRRIDEFPELSELNDTDIALISSGNNTYAVKVSTLKEVFGAASKSDLDYVIKRDTRTKYPIDKGDIMIRTTTGSGRDYISVAKQRINSASEDVDSAWNLYTETYASYFGNQTLQNKDRIIVLGHSNTDTMNAISNHYGYPVFPVHAGDLVFYTNYSDNREIRYLYRALVDIPEYEEFDASHWERVTIRTVIAEIDTRLTTVENSITAAEADITALQDTVDDVTESINLVTGRQANVEINSDGSRSATATTALWIAPVVAGVTYAILTDDAILQCGFYEESPGLYDATYDGKCIEQDSMIVTAPIDGYIAFRSSLSYTQGAITKGEIVLPYREPGELTAIDSVARAGVDDNTASVETLQAALAASEAQRLAMYPTDTAEGDVVVISDGAGGVPVKALVVDIDTQTGVTGATITRCGKNLCHLYSYHYTGDSMDVVYTNDGVTINGTPGSDFSVPTSGNVPQDGLVTLPPGTYRPSVTASGVGVEIVSYNPAAVLSSGEAFSLAAQTTVFARLHFHAGVTYDNLAVHIQLERGTAATDYEPYACKTYTVDWAGTVGAITSGTLDVTGGVLTTGGLPYVVTPVEVTTLQGANTIWADCGDVTVTYRVDPNIRDSATAEVISDLQSALADSEAKRMTMYPTGTVSGPVVAFPDGAGGVPVKALSIVITPAQAGTGDPSPVNERSISGRTATRIVSAGKNLFGANKIPSDNRQSCTTVDDGFVLTVLSEGTYKSTYFEIPGDFSGKNVYLKGIVNNSSSNDGRISVRFYSDSGEINATNRCEIFSGRQANVKTAPDGTTKLQVVCYSTFVNSATIGDKATFTNVMLSLYDEDYARYAGYNLYDIAFPSEAGTVYGGTLDVTTGLLTVDRVTDTLNGSEDWTLHGSNDSAFVCSTAASKVKKSANAETAGVLSNLFGVVANSSMSTPKATDTGIPRSGGEATRLYFLLRYDFVEDVTAWKTWLSAHPVQVSYLVANPVPYQLNPAQVVTLLGYNRIYADCGDVTVTYRADPTLQHDNLDGGDVGFSLTAQYPSNTVGAILREVYDNLFEAIQEIGKLVVAIDSTKMLVYNEDGTVTWEDAPS